MFRRKRSHRSSRIWRWVARGSMAAVLAGIGLSARGVDAGGRGAGNALCAAGPAAISDKAPALVLRRDGETSEARGSAEQQSESFSSSSRSAGLVEQPGVTEAGGVMVGLRGRFRTTLVLERKADGSTTTRCISNLPGASPGDR